MSRGLGRVQRAVLVDLRKRAKRGDHPLTTRHVAGFSRSAVSQAYGGLHNRGLIELWLPPDRPRGRGMLVRFPALDKAERVRIVRSNEAWSSADGIDHCATADACPVVSLKGSRPEPP
jgi:hypothetical protein